MHALTGEGTWRSLEVLLDAGTRLAKPLDLSLGVTRGGGGGQFVNQKWPKIVPFVNFVFFPRWSHWSGGGAGLLLRLSGGLMGPGSGGCTFPVVNAEMRKRIIFLSRPSVRKSRWYSRRASAALGRTLFSGNALRRGTTRCRGADSVAAAPSMPSTHPAVKVVVPNSIYPEGESLQLRGGWGVGV